MKLKFILFLALTMTYGCTEKGVDPCDLLTLDEVRRIAPGAQASDYHPASTSKTKDSELCLWHDGGDQNVFMLFYYTSDTSPQDLVRSGMPVGSRIIEISGVGDSAVAGFSKDDSSKKGSLKMFAARSKNKTIGIRVQGVSDENSERFRVLKEVAIKALTRL